MKPAKNNKSFFDKNTILAMLITFVLFFAWQEYLANKYPDAAKKKEALKKEQLAEAKPKSEGQSALAGQQEQLKTELKAPDLKATQAAGNKVFSFENEEWAFNINSKGLSVSDVEIKKINRVAKKPYKYSFVDAMYPTQFEGQDIYFNVQKSGDSLFVGTAQLSSGQVLTKSMEVDSETFTIKVKLELKGANSSFPLEHSLEAHISEAKKVIFFLPAFDRNEFYFYSDKDSERLILQTEGQDTKTYSDAQIVALSDHYFSTTYMSKEQRPSVTFKQNNKRLDILFKNSLAPSGEALNYEIFVGPKRIDLLEKSSSWGLTNIVNFSYLGFIARPIIKALNFIYSLVGNYGLAVFLLTLLIRLIILPLTVSSYRSMKKMQTIQPKLKEIKEKYKDNPQKVNLLTMEVMRENKVNPLGGCLPMLLQLPLFFAFYRALSESVDLYQAPFILWIKDLSVMDPYFVLPTISTVGMLVHQLVTPNNMEPLQRRMMLFMPLVFGFFIFTLPSALTLYMATTTWFGIGQHYVFLRDKSK